jgi:tRNA G18 (ribose-2'-O)-methylase SpoU
MIEIVDRDDPRLADYLNIPDADLIERRGVFVAEGRMVVRRLLASPRLRTRSVMVTPAARAALTDLAGSIGDIPIYVVPPALMNAVAGVNIHRGCLAIGERPPRRHWRDLLPAARLVIALERVGNADNVGGLFRNAAAFGADAVLLGPDCVDPLYRKAIRTSMAASLSLPFASAEPWPSMLRDLADDGFATVGLTPSASVPTVATLAPALRTGRIALLLGHEGEGLSAAAMALCRHVARIPMASGVDSLNVATAAAIALYELTR